MLGTFYYLDPHPLKQRYNTPEQIPLRFAFEVTYLIDLIEGFAYGTEFTVGFICFIKFKVRYSNGSFSTEITCILIIFIVSPLLLVINNYIRGNSHFLFQ